MNDQEPATRLRALADYVRQRRDALGGTLADTIGTELVELREGYCVMRLPFQARVQQLTGVFHAGALISLADGAGTLAVMSKLEPEALSTPGRFPLAINFSASLVRNTGQGDARAIATVVHFGRTTQVAEIRVVDDQERLWPW